MKISDIVAQISNGLARSNRFIVNLTPPSAITTALRGQGPGSSDYVGATATDYKGLHKILLLCDSAQLPGVTLNTTPIRTFGEVREIPYEINYEPITLTFFVDAEMNVKKMFDLWLLSTQKSDTRNFNYYNSYISDMEIYVQDMSEDNRYIVNLFECYPKTVSAVQLDFANRDVMKLQVNMMYKYWRSSQVAYIPGPEVTKPEFFDYTTNIDTTQYYENFTGFQQRYNAIYGTPEGFGNATGMTVKYY